MQLLADSYRKSLANTLALDKKHRVVAAMHTPLPHSSAVASMQATTTTARSTVGVGAGRSFDLQQRAVNNGATNNSNSYNNNNNNNTNNNNTLNNMARPTTSSEICDGGSGASGRMKNASVGRVSRIEVREFNELITCFICHGYMIDPTNVETCAHTFCRSCILKHLYSGSTVCPQCKAVGFNPGAGSRPLTESCLRSDDQLRALVFKLVPGLYQQERVQYSEYASNTGIGEVTEDDFFSPTEPISLSLEYHPALLQNCTDSRQAPPIRYLQCPAGVKIAHLKRFLCSKFDIDPENKSIDVQVIYEEEILPTDFTLMDVGYCYNWERHAPMRFHYRILVHGGGNEQQQDANEQSNRSQPTTSSHGGGSGGGDVGGGSNVGQKPISPTADKARQQHSASHFNKSVSFADEGRRTAAALAATSTSTTGNRTTAAQVSSKTRNDFAVAADSAATPMKVVIARRTSEHGGKRGVAPASAGPQALRRTHSASAASGGEEASSSSISSNNGGGGVTPNDFKSLRSNDIRYSSDYTVSSTTTGLKTAQSSATQAASTPGVGAGKQRQKSPGEAQTAQVMPKCDIVVSIPQSQVRRHSPNAFDEDYDNLSLAQLKTASKKSPPSASSSGSAETAADRRRNLPKLKIELTSLKTKLSIPKPKSADAIIIHTDDDEDDDGGDDVDDLDWNDARVRSRHADDHHGKRAKQQRKHSLDERAAMAAAASAQLDLETYAKNIGLKPIEVNAPVVVTAPGGGITDVLLDVGAAKYSPNASPRSSCSSSTTSSTHSKDSSNSTSSTHKKRKKKHSKDHSKDSSDGSVGGSGGGKRRKLHAEISSQPADESLKMKVKITGVGSTHHHKAHRSEARRAAEELLKATKKSEPSMVAVPAAATMSVTSSEVSLINTSLAMVQPGAKTLGQETSKVAVPGKATGSRAPIKIAEDKIMPRNPSSTTSSIPSLGTTSYNTSNNNNSKPNFTSKPVVNIRRDVKLPSSPPLPPSLFKTTPVTFPTLTAATTTTAAQVANNNNTSSTNNNNTHSKKTALPPNGRERSSLCSPPAISALPKPSLQAIKPHPKAATTGASLKSHFAVPNPPRPMAANALKYAGAPTSIASAANKQAQAGMQLKRSASLDESFAKRQRIEQDRQMRKTAYGAGHQMHMGCVGTLSSGTSAVAKFPAHLTLPQRCNSVEDRSAAAGSISQATSTTGGVSTTTGSPFEVPFYAPNSGAYMQELLKRGANLPPTSASPAVSICKVGDSLYSAPTTSMAASGAVSITPRQRAASVSQAQMHFLQQQQHLLQQQQHQQQQQFHHQQASSSAAGKSAVEIVRTSMPQSLPKTTITPGGGQRLMGPPPAGPLNRTGRKPSPAQSMTHGNMKSPPLHLSGGLMPQPMSQLASKPSASRAPTNSNTSTASSGNNNNNNNNGSGKTMYRSSPPALINLRHALPFVYPTPKSSAGVASMGAGHGATGKKTTDLGSRSGSASSSTTPTTSPKVSLRDFRPVSGRDPGSIDILDLSSSSFATGHLSASVGSLSSRQQDEIVPAAATLLSGSTLEALSKMKESFGKTTPGATKTSSLAVAEKPVASGSVLATSGHGAAKASSKESAAANDDLQNLHLLSESATAREKISIKSAAAAAAAAAAAVASTNAASMYEPSAKTVKLSQPPPMVRQQNASVRNIPNPSALAFRNQQQQPIPIPKSATTTTTGTSSSSATATTTTTSVSASATAATSTTTSAVSSPTTAGIRSGSPTGKATTISSAVNTDIEKITATTTTPTPTGNSSPKSPSSGGAGLVTQQSPPRITKKPTTIDQVAANLNIRAAAAEAAAHSNTVTPPSAAKKTADDEDAAAKKSLVTSSSPAGSSSSTAVVSATPPPPPPPAAAAGAASTPTGAAASRAISPPSGVPKKAADSRQESTKSPLAAAVTKTAQSSAAATVKSSPAAAAEKAVAASSKPAATTAVTTPAATTTTTAGTTSPRAATRSAAATSTTKAPASVTSTVATTKTTAAAAPTTAAPTTTTTTTTAAASAASKSPAVPAVKTAPSASSSAKDEIKTAKPSEVATTTTTSATATTASTAKPTTTSAGKTATPSASTPAKVTTTTSAAAAVASSAPVAATKTAAPAGKTTPSSAAATTTTTTTVAAVATTTTSPATATTSTAATTPPPAATTTTAVSRSVTSATTLEASSAAGLATAAV